MRIDSKKLIISCLTFIVLSLGIIGITLPDKIAFEVIETEPAVKGNTTNNAQKDAKIETGYVVKVPLFIQQGEKILITTEDGKYAGRA